MRRKPLTALAWLRIFHPDSAVKFVTNATNKALTRPIGSAFVWGGTPEGWDYWNDLDNQHYRYCSAPTTKKGNKTYDKF